MTSSQPPPEGEEIKAPFSFKLMVVLAVIYLGWRLIQGIVWLIGQIG
jgi:hypothetical protein